MFAGDRLWVLDNGKCEALDPQSGEVKKSYPAGSGHCFPPVATERFLFAGEMDMTDLETGQVDANRITKGACGRDAGFVPANGLIYAAPKHCVCWPMLRDYYALAAGRGRGGDPLPGKPLPEQFTRGKVARAEVPAATAAGMADAPTGLAVLSPRCLAERQHDRPGAGRLAILWTADLGDWPAGRDRRRLAGEPLRSRAGHAAGDCRRTGLRGTARRPPGRRPGCRDRESRWAFTANGRVDTPPTIHRGLCLFGTRSGWVYCLRADDGGLVWRLRAAPVEERIVAYGQIESPWPVPGSVWWSTTWPFSRPGASRWPTAGSSCSPWSRPTGKVLWVERLDSVPQKEFYGASSLEFESFDLLQCEGDAVAMSRWLFDRRDGRMRCECQERLCPCGHRRRRA